MRLLTFVTLILTVSAIGSTFEFVGSPTTTITVEGIKVPIYEQAQVNYPFDETRPSRILFLTGAGVYAKPVVFLSVNVYVAASYTDSATGFQNKDNPLPEIAAANTVAMHMTILRDLTKDQIRSAYEEMLDLNGVDLTNPVIQKSLKDSEIDLAKGSTSALIGYPGLRREEFLVLESPNQMTWNKGENLALDFWRSWFGVPVDKGIKNLKLKLTGKTRAVEWRYVNTDY